MRGIARVVALALAGALSLAAPAAADIHGKTNFAGVCQLQGNATFATPVTLTGGTNTLTLAAGDPSTCTGDLRYGVVAKGNRAWKVSVAASGTGLISCLRSDVPRASATISFLRDDGTPVTHDDTPVADGGIPLVLRLEVDVRGVTRDMTLVVRGGGSGRYPNGTNAEGIARFAALLDEAFRCGGAGFSALAFESQIATGPSQRRAANDPVTGLPILVPDNVLVTR